MRLFPAAVALGSLAIHPALAEPDPAIKTHAIVKAGSVSDKLYPREALAAKTEGRATVQFVVDEKGVPRDCIVIASSGSPLLDQATCAPIIKSFRFKPAKDDKGMAVPEPFVFAIAWKMPKDLSVFGPAPAR